MPTVYVFAGQKGGTGKTTLAIATAAELVARGHDVRVFAPLYSVIDRDAHRLAPVEFAQNVPVRMGDVERRFSLMSGQLPDTDLTIYFVDSPGLIDRDSIYTSDPDEPHRFALFSHAVLVGCQRMGWAPHVLHSNDWHTALIPLLLKTTYDWDALFATTKKLLTVHNLGYQGQFDARVIQELGLGPWLHLFDQDDTRGGRMNFLRTPCTCN